MLRLSRQRRLVAVNTVHRCLRLLAAVALVAAGANCRRAELDAEGALRAAQTALRRGATAEALAAVDHASDLLRRQPGTPRAVSARLLRAEILLTRGDLQEALSLVNEPLPDAPAFASLRARQQYLEARAQVAQGRLSDALATLDRAAAVEAGGAEVQHDAGVLGGQVLFRLGQWDAAEARLRQVVVDTARTGDRYRQLLALNNLGMGSVIRNRFDRALSWFERVLSFTDFQDTSVYAIALNNAGICYSRLGQFDRAVDVQRRAVDFHKGRGPSRDQSQALGQLAVTYLLQGRRDGLSYLQQALEIADQAGDIADATLWAGNLATAYANFGDWDQAERYNEQAQALWDTSHSGRAVYNTLNRAAIAEGRGHPDDAVALYREVVATPDAPPAVLWEAHAGLAGLFAARHRLTDSVREYEAALNIIERTRAGLLKTDYKVSFLSQLISFYQAYVQTLLDNGQPERALEIADSSRGRVLAERQETTAPARLRTASIVRLAAATDTIALSYWLTPRKSYLWIVTPGGVHVAALPPSTAIEPLVRRHQAAIASATADPLNAGGDELYRLLVAPAGRWLRPNARVVIVPDGVLHGLNFETLPVKDPQPHYWIGDAQVQVAPSLASLTARRQQAQPGSILLMGNATPREPEFPALRYAAAEMSGIASHFSQSHVTMLDREQATPASYRDAEPGRFAFVHFTAHATANFSSPLDSAVILSGSDSDYKLYARDVANLPLHAELVTVSACRSAGERAYAGEGLIGFAWAFLRAGAERVVAGLWDVDDRSTSELMDGVYARLAHGETPPQALREAKLALISHGGAFARPYYWAPFEMYTVTP